jgi:hypothetical protein
MGRPGPNTHTYDAALQDACQYLLTARSHARVDLAGRDEGKRDTGIRAAARGREQRRGCRCDGGRPCQRARGRKQCSSRKKWRRVGVLF